VRVKSRFQPERIRDPRPPAFGTIWRTTIDGLPQRLEFSFNLRLRILILGNIYGSWTITPEHLAPEFDEFGQVKTPFEEWWVKVQRHFSTVPEEVAREWLHRHWRHSPYCWLPSKDYRFKMLEWTSNLLFEIKYRTCNWDAQRCEEHGKYLVEDNTFQGKYFLKEFMLTNKDFPTAIIILDNRDGHLEQGKGCVPLYEDIPKGYVLIEGHRRFEIALYLSRKNQFSPTFKAWLMEHV
jgi:hypothetical protein